MNIQLDKNLIQNGRLKAIDLVKTLVRYYRFNTSKVAPLKEIALKDLNITKAGKDLYIIDANIDLNTMILTLTLKENN